MDRTNAPAARFRTFKLEKRTDLGTRICLIALAVLVVCAGAFFLGLFPGAGPGVPLDGRGVVRSSLILGAGIALLLGAILLLLRETKVLPALVAFRVGQRVVLVAIALRRPLAVVRVGTSVLVSSERHDTPMRSVLRGSFVKTWFDWQVGGSQGTVAWTMGEPMSPMLVNLWRVKLLHLGLSESD